MFIDYWYRLCIKNNCLNKNYYKMTISVESFKKELEKSYEQGKIDGEQRVKDMVEKDKNDNSFANIFKNMFN